MTLVLKDVAYDDALAVTLADEVQREYVIRYGGTDATPMDGSEFAPPHGAFLIGFSDDEAIGCAGLRRHSDGVVEIKRMFVRAAHRRNGYGRWLLQALEERARSLGYGRVILETGTPQPEAMALYAGEGYEPITPYGHYRNSPYSRCFGKDL